LPAALRSLRALGVDGNRVAIERIGGGWPANAVVSQSPAPATPLRSTTRVVLRISAPAAVDALPYPMRNESETALGTDRLMALLDSPIARLNAFVAEAGGFLELRPDVVESGWRWIREVFQLEPGDLPADFVYALARFLPALPRVAGTERGLALGLQALFGLPLQRVQFSDGLAPMAIEHQTRLGVHNGRLGIDAVIGDGMTQRAHASVIIGPISLATHSLHDTSLRRAHRQLLYHLVMPCSMLHVSEAWHVDADPGGARAGVPDQPLRLGLNSRLTQ